MPDSPIDIAVQILRRSYGTDAIVVARARVAEYRQDGNERGALGMQEVVRRLYGRRPH